MTVLSEALPPTFVPELKRQWTLGVAVDQLDLTQAVAVCASRRSDAPFAYVATPNAMMHVQVFRGVEPMMRGLDGAWLLINDSRIVQRLVSLLFGQALPLATGSDLTVELFEKIIAADDPICIVGGDDVMASTLRARYGLSRLVQVIPSFGFIRDPAEIARCAAFVREHPSRFVFIACGPPQSEILASVIVKDGGATGLGLCIGASLEFLTGKKRRAPMIWQRLGMEWFYRVLQEPRRLTRRLFTLQLPLLLVALRYRVQGSPTLPSDGRRTVAWPRR
jgi:exopolysaccharide biosynthesis WecB/TagA/CpsF family protein